MSGFKWHFPRLAARKALLLPYLPKSLLAQLLICFTLDVVSLLEGAISPLGNIDSLMSQKESHPKQQQTVLQAARPCSSLRKSCRHFPLAAGEGRLSQRESRHLCPGLDLGVISGDGSRGPGFHVLCDVGFRLLPPAPWGQQRLLDGKTVVPHWQLADFADRWLRSPVLCVLKTASV